jgi:flagellar FliJ protein
MAKPFRLASVLRIREINEKEAAEDFALSATREREHDETLDRAKHVLSAKFGSIPGSIQNVKSYAALRQASMDQLSRMEMMAPQFAAAKSAAAERYSLAAQELKAVEKLRDKHDAAEELEEERAEEAELDETSMFRNGRETIL